MRMSKQEKKGLVPERRFPEFKDAGEWKNELFEKVYSFKTTNSLSRDKLNYKQGTVKNIHYGDIHTKFSILFDIEKENVPYINSTESLEKIKPDSYCVEGDMIFADASEDMNDIGKSIEIVSLNNEKLVSGLHTLLARQIKKKLVAGFGGYLFKSNRIREQIKKESQGAKVLGLSGGRLSSISVAYPADEKEQQKIADCLTSVDELITAQTQKLDSLKAHKKGLMQYLFPSEGETVPKLRFPEFDEVLKTVGFAELGEIKIGLTHKPEYLDSGKPFLSSRNISNGYIDFENIKYISEEKFSSMPESTKPKVGDILFTRVGSNLGNPIILEEDKKFGIFVSLGIFRVNKSVSNYYVKHWMDSEFFWVQVKQKVAGGAKDNLNTTWLKEFKLSIPSFAEQQKIADCLTSIDELIANQTKKVELLKTHKNGLMQQLFPAMEEVK